MTKRQMRTITASEIGTYLFCHRAWRFQQDGAQSARAPERARGTAYHAQHGRRVEAARKTNAAAGWCLALGLALLALALAAAVL